MTSVTSRDESRASVNIQTLPDETLISILRHLHFQDIVSVSQTCSRFHQLSLDDELWRWQCEHYYLEDTCEEGQTWRNVFIRFHKNFGRYPDYKEIKHAWNKIEDFLKQPCPTILASLNEGITEDDLDAFEQRIEEKLPLDFRVSYRIHNGQSLETDSPGLMGGGMVTSHLRSDALLPISYVESTYKNGGSTSGCAIVTQDLIGHSMQMLAIGNDGGYSPGHVYDAISGESTYNLDCFIAAKSFKEWLCSYAERLAGGQYHILKEYIVKFYREPSCIATTIGISVKPYSCFIPELSCVSSPHIQYFFAYRIVIEMSEDTPSDLACRLETRHWTITDGDGNVTTVNGPGVVGEHPVLKPGKSFAWISCCTFDTPSGSMEGHFKFRNLQDGTVTEVECPCYHMQALPSLTARERGRIIRQLRLAQPDHENG